MTRIQPSQWNFDIDRFINPFVPHPPWRHLPTPVSRFFGYRKTKPDNTGNFVLILWAFIGIFCGIAVIELVSDHVPSFRHHGAPIIVGSFGAAAVLELFLLAGPAPFADVRWVAGALSCATATALMALTKTVHPPAGATALLAVVDDSVLDLGWFLVPVVMLGCALMLVTALLVNNVQRRFPMYWWTPEDLHAQVRPWTRRRASGPPPPPPSSSAAAAAAVEAKAGVPDHSDLEAQSTRTSQTTEVGGSDDGREFELVLRAGEVIVPEHMYITPEEKMWLENLSNRL
ncbi:HPP family protein [Verticillium alfalfae VaMs.102]|uniref:HPP family protein n=1 Tax=Verticillium alfalfae (strain VaMs.102 / ATCC MYA-4576 / FGSC 10136) TaxID=526221 RepID=C9SLH5_VERA1|nr:HPP family protein [Verticillium alfalfae VaMs.102]EEY19543.1 HPP family protein [Verticillium alfalfae VaMs.102]